MSEINPISSDMFETLMARVFAGAFDSVSSVAVGVSGGADSMALLWLLQGWCAAHGRVLYVLSVDHGLRNAARGECQDVAQFCAGLGDHVIHQILVWDAPCEVRIQEEARNARYALMDAYCYRHGIKHLFLGHHEDDQAETVLFRLAKGSGLDGLSGMRSLQYRGNLILCRPFLGVSKDDLADTCRSVSISFSDDPSNCDEHYARVRLRKSADVLAAEGLTAKRLSVTAKRLDRARESLDFYAQKTYNEALLISNSSRIEFSTLLSENPDEIVLRVIIKALALLREGASYAPRMERVEALVYDLKYAPVFRKRTLGGVVFARDDGSGKIILLCEM